MEIRVRMPLIVAILVLAPVRGAPQGAAWIAQLSYRPTEVTAIRAGPARMPLVEVKISGISHWLLFDSGDMVGLSLTTSELSQHSLPVDSTWRRLASDGRVIGTFRRMRGSSVHAFGRALGDLPVFEINESIVPGLIGPDHLPGNRFTLDYRAGLLAVTDGALGTLPAEFAELPLVRSPRHPRLILAFCTVAGRPVLTEFDTGKTRTVIAPRLVEALGLRSTEDGVRLDALQIGPTPFAVSSAKVVSLAAIDQSLPAPIELSVGSDVMSQMLITVDYAAHRLVFRRQARE